MADVLSQKEIDSLLNAWTSGEIDVAEIEEKPTDKKVREYDFRRPHKFSKDQLRTLQMIHENFSRAASSYLSGALRVFCDAEVAAVEPQTYHEFINSLPEIVVLAVVDFNPLKKNSSVIMLPSDITFAIVDRLLGGVGDLSEKSRSFSEIELALIERIIKRMLAIMGEAWSTVIKADFKLVRTESSAQFVQIVSPNETMAIVTINLNVGGVDGMINVCIPHLVLEPILENLSTKYWYSSRMQDETSNRSSSLLSKSIETADIECKAILGETTITVRDFLHLQHGDVIQLQKNINSDVDFFVGNIRKFRGHIGSRSKRLAVKISAIERGNERA